MKISRKLGITGNFLNLIMSDYKQNKTKQACGYIILHGGRLRAFPLVPIWESTFTTFIKHPYDSVVSFLEIYPREMNTYLHKDLYRSIYRNFIHKSLKLEIIKISSTCE